MQFLCLWTAEEYVIALEGHTLVLPCTYSVEEGIAEICWGKSRCSGSCYKVIIWTNTREKTLTVSERYKLRGNITRGDGSLTITGLTPSDSGTFCCRVETPGGLSYEKNRIQLCVTVNVSVCPFLFSALLVLTPDTSSQYTFIPHSHWVYSYV
uniref:Ig-like domain-containing protein n=1 Tax=Xenopus tropicalis TaxID=8364 RepID=A0A803KFH6_XENTR